MAATRWDERARLYFQRLEDDLHKLAGASETALESGLVHGPLDGLSDDDFASFCRCDPVDAEALVRLLEDLRARHFVKLLVCATRSVPEPLFLPMVKAGVRATYQEGFILPCVICHGRRRTMASLMALAKDGSDSDKAGAMKALYWGAVPQSHAYWPHGSRRTDIDKPDESVDDLARALAAWAAREFVRNPNVDVRLSLIPYLRRTSEVAPDEMKRAIRSLEESLEGRPDRDLAFSVLGQLPPSIRYPSLFREFRRRGARTVSISQSSLR